ncbi:MAG: glycosyl transferase family 1 [Planctomycetota bacterium]|nr:MAG: glycosyl transferase family 1 [Planctomycetota bacterium]
MKILLCHTYYLQRGGEDCCYEEERDYLRAHGHSVIEYVRHNGEMTRMGPLSAAATTIWSRRAAREIAALIDDERPDVLHCTNAFPTISPAACYVAHRRGVPVVQALQNYRWLCANGYLMRSGGPCEQCVKRPLPLAAVRHRCYRNSFAATAAVVAMQAVHHRFGRYASKVDAFFAPTQFARQRFIEGGFPPERTHVKWNFVSRDAGVGRGDGGYVMFAGRLSPEKGVATLLEAWRRDPALPRLVIAGDGPLADAVRTAALQDGRIDWRGAVPLGEVQKLMGAAAAVVMPSVWYETFGRTIVEALSCGTPVVASRLGAMAELVEDGRTGVHFAPASADDLASKVRAIVALPADRLAHLRRAARSAYESRFTAAANYQRLMEIYDLAAAHTHKRRRPTHDWRPPPAPQSGHAAANPEFVLMDA